MLSCSGGADGGCADRGGMISLPIQKEVLSSKKYLSKRMFPHLRIQLYPKR